MQRAKNLKIKQSESRRSNTLAEQLISCKIDLNLKLKCTTYVKFHFNCLELVILFIFLFFRPPVSVFTFIYTYFN